MITDLKPYPEYRQTELPWCTLVPSHWGLVPNRGLIRRRKVLVGDRHTEYRLLSLTKQGVIVRDISTGKGKFSSDMGTSQEVRDGDLVCCLFDVPETPRTVGLSRHKGMITGAYTVFESLGRGYSKYFELFYQAMDDRKLLSPLYSGLRNTILAARFLGTKSPLPPLEEQEAIVRFLNWANVRLERAIRSKRKVIALLNEQKQAIIHRAVTRGLDPDVALKPSGVPWLGDIPAHWEVRRVKSCAANVSDQTTTLDEGGVYIALENVQSWTGVVKPQLKAGEPLFSGQVKRFKPNDVLFGKLRPNLAKAVTIETFGVCSSEFFVLRTNSTAAPAFLECIFRTKTIVDVVTSSTFGAKMPRADWQFFGNLKVALPPLDEQLHIVKTIGIGCMPISHAVLQLECEIELLSEYRTSLVAAVVTGKLDVREAAAKLTEDTSLHGAQDVEPGDDIEILDEEVSE